MELIQLERVVKINRSSSVYFFIRENYDPQGRLISYEYIDRTPVSPKAKHYSRFKTLMATTYGRVD